MPLVSKQLAGLFNGVSQQAPTMRMPSQAEVQENAFSSLVYGLHKRPPFQHVSNWSGFSLSDVAFCHKIDRDYQEKYIVTKDVSSGLKVHSLTGVAYPVVLLGGAGAYLTSGNPRADFKMVTLADYTLIVNNKFTVTMKPSVDPVAAKDLYAYIFVKKGVAEQTYSVVINGATYTYTSGVSTDTASYKTTYIAQQLKTAISADPTLTIDIVGSTIRLKKTNSAEFTFKCFDSWGDAAIKGIKGTSQSFKDLPTLCFSDARVKVIEESTVGLGAYWVNYSFTDPANMNTSGQWVESRDPFLQNAIDPTTMPQKMVRKQSATYITTGNPLGIYFEVSSVEWNERMVGDEVTAPTPSFVGGTISDIFLYRNRLGILSKQALVLSRAGEFFDFFPQTVMSTLDDDPIDVEAPAMDASVLTFALPVNDHLMLFSEKQKFIVTSGTVALSNATISVAPVMTLASDPFTVPVRAGQMVFFLSPHGNYQGVREYYVQPDYISNDAPDIASHVPKLIPNVNAPSIMESLPNHEVVFVMTPNNPTELYVYKYTWSGDQKVQSSWSKWITSGMVIRSLLSFGNLLYLVTSSGIAVVDLTYDQTVLCKDLGTNDYTMKYRFSPMYIRTTETGPGELEGHLLYRKLSLAVIGKSYLDLLVESKQGGANLDYVMDTSSSADSDLSVNQFLLRGENTNTSITLTDTSNYLTTIQSASFELFGSKRSSTMP